MIEKGNYATRAAQYVSGRISKLHDILYQSVSINSDVCLFFQICIYIL